MTDENNPNEGEGLESFRNIDWKFEEEITRTVLQGKGAEYILNFAVENHIAARKSAEEVGRLQREKDKLMEFLELLARDYEAGDLLFKLVLKNIMAEDSDSIKQLIIKAMEVYKSVDKAKIGMKRLENDPKHQAMNEIVEEYKKREANGDFNKHGTLTPFYEEMYEAHIEVELNVEAIGKRIRDYKKEQKQSS